MDTTAPTSGQGEHRTAPIVRFGPILLAVALATGYAWLLAWFDQTDFYHRHFFDYGDGVRKYQRARLVFIFYFAWIIYAVGAGVVVLITGRQVLARLAAWERYPLCFVAGAGISHLALFFVGLAGFYLKSVAIGTTLVVLILSIPHLANCLREVGSHIARAQPRLSAELAMKSLLVVGTLIAAAAFLAVKGLYPGGGHDYYDHYFPFYKRVIETGSILPNDVWYHFYYSKGAGLHFLAMLLTDPIAPQLATTAFIGCGAWIVYALLRRATIAPLLPWVGVSLYVALFIYTPGPGGDFGHGGWGILEKLHELTAVFLLAVIWIAYRLFNDDDNAPAPWALALHMAIAGIALLTLPLISLVVLYLGGYVIWFVAKRQWRIAAHVVAAGITAVTCAVLIAAINYYYTGFPSDQVIAQFWPYADLHKVVQWGTTFEFLVAHRAATAATSFSAPITGAVWHLATFLRLELWWPLILTALPFVVLQLRSRDERRKLRRRLDVRAWCALTGFTVAVIPVALFGGGMVQSVSFYRLSTFCYAPTLCISLLLWHLAADRETLRKTRVGIGIAALVVVVVALAGTTVMLNADKIDRSTGSSFGAVRRSVADKVDILIAGLGVIHRNISNIASNASLLWTGALSLKDAYQKRDGWPGRTPWGAIYPGLLEPWKIVGARVRIWSFHVQSYCMLPDCNLQGGDVSFRFSPSWHTVYFGRSEDAVRVLKSEGLNFFFFSKELVMRDHRVTAPFLSPANIKKYLAIRWTDGVSYLLTWPGPDTTPIDDDFLQAYGNAVNTNGTGFEAYGVPVDNNASGIDTQTLRAISNYIELHKSDLRPFFLPWCTNCAGLDRLPGAAPR